mgnify:CR=1 FL=1
MASNSIDFKTFNAVAPFVVADKKPVLIRGRHGIGKSEIVYQIAETLGLPIVERRASQMTEGDLMGLPSVNGDSTSWNPPDWFKLACEEAVVLFLDEIDRATIEVRQGIFELTDSRKLNGHRLHKDTVIFGAINGGEHGAQYQVGEFDPAELDRWTVFDVEPTVKDWLDWANDNVDSAIWDFVNNNHNHLEHEGEFEPNKVYPSRRSWKRLSDCLVKGKLAEKATPVLFNLACAYVGFEAGVAFNDFIENYKRVVTVADLLDKGKVKKTKDFGINEHSAMVEKLEAEKVFHKVLSDKRVKNLAKYFVTLPSEVSAKLWTVMGQEGTEIDNTINLHKCKVDGKMVSEYFVKIYNG